MEADNEARRKKLQTLFAVGITIGVLAIAAPVLVMALEGLLALIAIGIVGVTTIMFAPVVAMKMANLRMKMIVEEAEKNPIETLQNVYVERTNEYNQTSQDLEDWDTEIRNFDDEANGFKKEYPEDTFQNKQYSEISEAMHQGLADAREDHAQAEKDLEALNVAIKKAKAIYKMALATQKVTQFSKDAQAKVFQDIKTQVAFDSVRSNLNRSFSKLNTAMTKRQQRPSLSVAGSSKPALTEGNSDIIPAVITETEKVPVRRVN